MIEQSLLDFAFNNGFAAVIAIYSLTTLAKSVKENTKAITELRLAISKIC